MKRAPSGSHIRDMAVQELEHTEPDTLSSWILTQQAHRAPQAGGNLTQLLTAIAVGCKFIATAVRKVRAARGLLWGTGRRAQGRCSTPQRRPPAGAPVSAAATAAGGSGSRAPAHCKGWDGMVSLPAASVLNKH